MICLHKQTQKAGAMFFLDLNVLTLFTIKPDSGIVMPLRSRSPLHSTVDCGIPIAYKTSERHFFSIVLLRQENFNIIPRLAHLWVR
jgi:hypothetical protein